MPVRLGVGVRYASSALKELVDAWTHGDFALAHYVVHMPQRRALCRGQAGEVIVGEYDHRVKPLRRSSYATSSLARRRLRGCSLTTI